MYEERRMSNIHSVKNMNNQFILTGKDVLYLNDLLDQCDVLSKRITHEIPLIQNENVQQCFEEVNQEIIHQYDALLELLSKEAKK